MRTIVLVRHGRSAHVHTGWVNVAEFRRWREAYEAAGIVDDERPPMMTDGGVVVASTAPRAVQSARLLRDEVIVSPLLRELDLEPPHIPRVRLPMIGWALLIGLRARATPAEKERATDAAEWLSQLAQTHGSVVAVTHAAVRAEIARALVSIRWRRDGPHRSRRHWSAWTLSRD
ncbi:MAG TPA: hypothetical protein VM733_04885 [Thermoanaerobaculia bacterium]|nr:hypothetical protein [Thermoanaerobaculia bacterium]